MKIGRIENSIISVVFVICIAAVLYYVWKKYALLEGFEDGGDKNYLDGVDAIYWINLDRSTDRRAKMEAMFKDPVFKGIDIIRVKAVDGKAPDIDNVLKENFEQIGTKQTKIEYACLLSHLNTIKEFNNSAYETALILEDDMTLEWKPYWKKTVKEIIDGSPSDWEIIQLCVIVDSKNKLNKMYNLNDGDIYSTGAYIINKKGADTVKSWETNNKNKLDKNKHHTADNYINGTCKTYAYKYPMFIYEDENDSNINEKSLNFQMKSKKMVNKIIKNI